MADFAPYAQLVNSLNTSAPKIGDALALWALLRSHLKIAEYFRIGTINHPEVRRAPILADAFLANLAENVDRHVNVQTFSIFNEDIAGSFDEIRSWQETGYPLDRTESNYPRRLLVWKAIYENAPIIRKTKSGDRKEIDITGKYNTSFESIIEARMEYAGGERVPYWYVLNYGTDVGPLSGYPNVGGIHFLEKAQATIPGNLSLAEEYLDRYYAAALEGHIIQNVPVGIDQESGWILLYGKSRGGNIRYAAINFRTGAANSFGLFTLPAGLREFIS